MIQRGSKVFHAISSITSDWTNEFRFSCFALLKSLHTQSYKFKIHTEQEFQCKPILFQLLFLHIPILIFMNVEVPMRANLWNISTFEHSKFFSQYFSTLQCLNFPTIVLIIPRIIKHIYCRNWYNCQYERQKQTLQKIKVYLSFFVNWVEVNKIQTWNTISRERLEFPRERKQQL